ncbi:sensor histidine kinase [Spirillospora albida]|uniref:sensor histidine kinase n=1 Tax=Spirillospora albida TaxID=58123 RepID=UPI000AE62383|nr:sensor histidine kinase [Spirillospora albida]
MPTPDDRSRIHRWNAALWVLVGLVPMLIAGLGDHGAMRYWSSGVPVVLGVAYAIALRFPGERTRFLWLLVAGMGVLSYLRGGAASLFVTSLPLFWFSTRTVGGAVTVSGAAAAATVAGGILRTGDPLAGNQVITVAACASGAVIGALVHRLLQRAEERSRRLSAELERARLELAESHRRQGVAEERERLAREIHDTLAQGFASIVALAEAARTGMAADPATAARQLLSIERTARENLVEARALVGSAPQNGTAPASIARTLRRTLDRFAEDTGLAVAADLAEVDCDQATRIAILRCVQESLANVRRHAAASTVGVVLTRRPDGVELEVTDDGRGFTPGDARGFGLAGMRRRVTELGGAFTVTASPGDGTRVFALLPIDAQPHEG